MSASFGSWNFIWKRFADFMERELLISFVFGYYIIAISYYIIAIHTVDSCTADS